MHGYLLHHVVAEGRDLARDGDGAAGEAQAQPAVGGLAAGVHLALRRHCGVRTGAREPERQRVRTGAREPERQRVRTGAREPERQNEGPRARASESQNEGPIARASESQNEGPRARASESQNEGPRARASESQNEGPRARASESQNEGPPPSLWSQNEGLRARASESQNGGPESQSVRESRSRGERDCVRAPEGHVSFRKVYYYYFGNYYCRYPVSGSLDWGNRSPAKRLFDPPATCTTLRAERVSEKEGTLICRGTGAEFDMEK